MQPQQVFFFFHLEKPKVTNLHTLYKTVSKPLEDIVKETEAIVTTLVSKQYKPTTVESMTHTILGRPLYIVKNANGDILWTGRHLLILRDSIQPQLCFCVHTRVSVLYLIRRVLKSDCDTVKSDFALPYNSHNFDHIKNGRG